MELNQIRCPECGRTVLEVSQGGPVVPMRVKCHRCNIYLTWPGDVAQETPPAHRTFDPREEVKG